MAEADLEGRASGRARPARWAWTGLGLLCVGLGGVGVVVPGLPSTIFFICAAACFSRSSPRLEGWLLGLGGIGRLVRDHRAGLGMPRRAKALAVTSIVAFGGAGALLGVQAWWLRALVVCACAIGVWVVLRQPTRPPAVG